MGVFLFATQERWNMHEFFLLFWDLGIEKWSCCCGDPLISVQFLRDCLESVLAFSFLQFYEVMGL